MVDGVSEASGEEPRVKWKRVLGFQLQDLAVSMTELERGKNVILKKNTLQRDLSLLSLSR